MINIIHSFIIIIISLLLSKYILTIISLGAVVLVENMQWKAVTHSIPSITLPSDCIKWTPSTTGRLIFSMNSIFVHWLGTRTEWRIEDN